VGDEVAKIVAQAHGAGKPLVIEKLDFRNTKAERENVDPRQARMRSSFACKQVASGIESAAFRGGVEAIELNPARSVTGATNYARRHGISVHQGAACAIARRWFELVRSSGRAQGMCSRARWR
jgi:hypothetical protein